MKEKKKKNCGNRVAEIGGKRREKKLICGNGVAEIGGEDSWSIRFEQLLLEIYVIKIILILCHIKIPYSVLICEYVEEPIHACRREKIMEEKDD